MTNHKYNQIRNKKIQSFPKTDRQKLVGIRTFIRERYYPDKIVNTMLEPYLGFTKGEDEFVFVCKWLSEDLVKKYNIHPADMLLFTSNHRQIYFELDGGIHDIKTEKTNSRNARYELNHIPYIVINEADLKLKLGVPKSTKLTQDQINAEFGKRLEEMLS